VRAHPGSRLVALVVLWFLALSFLIVLVVFDSPQVDYRLVMVGSVLPWLDFVWGDPWPLHSVLFAVALMVLVMVAGWGRRLLQRRWIGLAIGVFMHLVLSGTWRSQKLFWWPVFGSGAEGESPAVPGLTLALALEAVGLIAVWVLWQRVGFADARRRKLFITTGHIDRRVMSAR